MKKRNRRWWSKQKNKKLHNQYVSDLYKRFFGAINENIKNKPPECQIHCSKTVFDTLKEQAKPSLSVYGIEIKESPIFPFQNSAGEWIHGAFIPPIETLIDEHPKMDLDIESTIPDLHWVCGLCKPIKFGNNGL